MRRTVSQRTQLHYHYLCEKRDNPRRGHLPVLLSRAPQGSSLWPSPVTASTKLTAGLLGAREGNSPRHLIGLPEQTGRKCLTDHFTFSCGHLNSILPDCLLKRWRRAAHYSQDGFSHHQTPKSAVPKLYALRTPLHAYNLLKTPDSFCNVGYS